MTVSLNYINNNLPLFMGLDRKLIIAIEDISEANYSQANFILNGESLQVLKKLPDAIIQTVVTSPPYYGQRNYCMPLQVGIEPTPDEYLSRLLEIFDEMKRVLKDDGTFWLNIGDKYIDGNLAGLPWRLALALKQKVGF